jgi:hypothetical protein
LEEEGYAGAARSESGLSGWPSRGEVIQTFWAAPANPDFWGYEGWIIYRSVRVGMQYWEEIALGGPMTSRLALNFLRQVEEQLADQRIQPGTDQGT